MGHIVVMDDSEAQFALTHYSRTLWDDLVNELPPEAEYERRGTLWVAANAEELAVVHTKAVYYIERGVRAEILTENDVRSAEPNLRPGLAGGLLVPDDGVVYAPFVARWLLDRALNRGARMERGARVIELSDSGVRLADGREVHTPLVLCATGTAATALFPELPIRPRKGHLAITDRYPGFVRHQLVELGYLTSAHGHANESVAFNIQPRATGQVLIGSSRQYGEARTDIDAPVLARMLSRAIEYMPGLAALSVIRAWTGFRAATDDKLPLLGPAPHREGVYLATGHEGLGITTSLGSAALLTDLILDRSPAIPIEPYLPSRAVEPAHA
jgi:glycine/D-amino acid oxidase-like deaminating enzyme